MLPSNLLSLESLSEGDLLEFFNSFGDPLKAELGEAEFWNERTSVCRGKVAAMLFLEPSLRTRTSFEASLKRMGGNTVDFSSLEQALSDHPIHEDVEEAGRFLAQYVDLIVVRSPDGSVPARLAANADVPVVSAGHGAEDHPTAALGQLHTIHRHHGRIRNLVTLVVGKMPKRCLNSIVDGLLSAPGQQIHVVTPSPPSPARMDGWMARAGHMGSRIATHATLEEALAAVDLGSIDVVVCDETGEDYSHPHDEAPAALITDSLLQGAGPEMLLLHMKPVLRILDERLAAGIAPRLAQESRKSGLMRAEIMLRLMGVQPGVPAV